MPSNNSFVPTRASDAAFHQRSARAAQFNRWAAMRRLLISIVLGAVSMAAQAEERSSMPSPKELKMISYRGGLVFFALPIAWHEEYEPDGGATFYEDRPNSGTLRLNVLSFSSKDDPAEKMAATAFPKGSFELLTDGFPMRRTVVDGEERGHKLHLHTWEIAVPVAPHSLRIVVFRHTVLAGQEKDPAIAHELEFIDRSIRAGTFSQEQGVAGKYIQK